MALLSLDPRFDFTTYAMQVCYSVYPYLKLHINLFRGRRKQKAKTLLCLGEELYTIERFESTIEEYKVNYALFEKKTSKLLRCEIG